MTIDINLTLRADDSLRSLLAALLDRPTAPENDTRISPNTEPATTAAPTASPAPVSPAAPVVPVAPVAPAPVNATAAPMAPVAPAPANQPQTPIPVPAVPTTPAPGYTLDQLSRAGAVLSSADPAKRNQLVALLQQFGLQTISQLPPEQYGAFATALRGLGAAI